MTNNHSRLEQKVPIDPIFSVVLPLENNVTLGRGSPSRHFPGNQRLRGICQQLAPFYLKADCLERKRLKLIAIATINSNGAMFFTKDGNGPVPLKIQRDKVGQRIRDEIDKATEPVELETMDLNFLMDSIQHAKTTGLMRFIMMANDSPPRTLPAAEEVPKEEVEQEDWPGAAAAAPPPLVLQNTIDDPVVGLAELVEENSTGSSIDNAYDDESSLSSPEVVENVNRIGINSKDLTDFLGFPLDSLEVVGPNLLQQSFMPVANSDEIINVVAV